MIKVINAIATLSITKTLILEKEGITKPSGDKEMRNRPQMIYELCLIQAKSPIKLKKEVYGNEALLPFYLLHQTVFLCVGWIVIPWDIGIVPKYLLIAVISFALIIALYKLLIRRFNIVRFFFGMRAKKKL